MVCWSQEELERMRTTIEDFVSLTGDRDREGERESSVPGEEVGLAQPPQKDGLAFHGIAMDSMETSSKTEDLKRNFLDHNIRRILKKEWNIYFKAKFAIITRFVKLKLTCYFLILLKFRYEKGPQLNGLDPIVVTFQSITDKEVLWLKIRENKTRSKVVVTQFSSNNLGPRNKQTESRGRHY